MKDNVLWVFQITVAAGSSRCTIQFHPMHLNTATILFWMSITQHSHDVLQPHFCYVVNAGRSLLWAAKTEKISADRYKLQSICLSQALKKKRPQFKERHDKGILHYEISQNKLGNTQMWSSTPVAWHRSVRLLPLPIDCLCPSSSAFYLIRRCQQIGGFIDCIQKWWILSQRNP